MKKEDFYAVPESEHPFEFCVGCYFDKINRNKSCKLMLKGLGLQDCNDKNIIYKKKEIGVENENIK